MSDNPNLPAPMRILSQQERDFVLAYVKFGNAKNAKIEAGYADSASESYLMRRPAIAAAIRAEVVRQLATEGAQIGFGCLKRIAKDEKAPAAAQVSAAKALLQAAGLLEAPTDSGKSKSINDMDRDELRGYIEQKRAEVDQLEARLASGAQDITPGRDSDASSHVDETPDPFG
jgi:hypothetical protein